jgi:hypothetical protein
MWFDKGGIYFAGSFGGFYGLFLTSKKWWIELKIVKINFFSGC